MAEQIKVYEEKKSPSPLLWLIPLLLLLGLAAWYFTRHHAPAASTAMMSPAAPTAAGAFPDLGTVHFDTDKATLTSDGQATLDRAAAAMQANPAAHLRLEGYTDSTGTVPHNDSLSDQRAATVANYLKAKGIDGSRLTGAGFGEANPKDTNATPSGKADNRRVELFSQK